jgi:hypothetical protein
MQQNQIVGSSRQGHCRCAPCNSVVDVERLARETINMDNDAAIYISDQAKTDDSPKYLGISFTPGSHSQRTMPLEAWKNNVRYLESVSGWH